MKNAANTHEPATCASSPLLPSCPRKLTGSHGAHSEGSQSVKVISIWHVGFGNMHSVNSRHGYDAYEQLAMYYEHKVREPEQARQIVQQALDELSRAIQSGDIAPGPYREIKARFDRRMERLNRKNGRPLLTALMTQAQA